MTGTSIRSWLFRPCIVATLAAAGALVAAQPSTAHPHVWIDARATLVFEHGALVGIQSHWTLDPFVSALLKEDFDSDKDGAFDAEEIGALEAATFVGLSEFGFYTHIRINGADYSPQSVEGFRPTIEGDVVTYRFYIPLPEPVDPARQAVDVAYYDETFFSDLYTEEGWTTLSGDQVAGCVPVHEVDYDSPYYFGVVFPTRIGLRCAEG